MKEIDRQIAELARQQHQVFSRSQAIEAGLSQSGIWRRIQSGLFVACGARALAFGGTDLAYRGKLMAGLLDLGPSALVSGRAAAALLGLDGFAEGPLEFLQPRTQRDRSTLGRVTSTSQIERLDWTVVDGLRCTSGTRTVVQILTYGSELEAANALDSGTRLHLTAPTVVRRRLDELGTQGRAGIALFGRVMASAGVQSWLERQFLALMRSSGLPKPAIQRTYRADGVHVARVDFDFDPLPIIIEVGGRRGYLSLAERRRQERRRNELQLLGKTMYFFSTEEVVENGAYVVETTRRALGIAA